MVGGRRAGDAPRVGTGPGRRRVRARRRAGPRLRARRPLGRDRRPGDAPARALRSPSRDREAHPPERRPLRRRGAGAGARSRSRTRSGTHSVFEVVEAEIDRGFSDDVFSLPLMATPPKGMTVDARATDHCERLGTAGGRRALPRRSDGCGRPPEDARRGALARRARAGGCVPLAGGPRPFHRAVARGAAPHPRRRRPRAARLSHAGHGPLRQARARASLPAPVQRRALGGRRARRRRAPGRDVGVDDQSDAARAPVSPHVARRFFHAGGGDGARAAWGTTSAPRGSTACWVRKGGVRESDRARPPRCRSTASRWASAPSSSTPWRVGIANAGASTTRELVDVEVAPDHAAAVAASARSGARDRSHAGR